MSMRNCQKYQVESGVHEGSPVGWVSAFLVGRICGGVGFEPGVKREGVMDGGSSEMEMNIAKARV